MTVIVGLVDGGKVYMGGDSSAISGDWLAIRKDVKVFKRGEFLIGFTTSFRMGQLLAHALVPPAPNDGEDIFAFMVTSFVDAIRDCFKAGGYARKTAEAEEAGVFLVGLRGRLFEIESDYQVGESLHGYASVGAGCSYALGSLFTSGHLPPRDRVEVALNAAEALCPNVRGPFIIEMQ
jgi:ATP-dependent protease HslVU (ClpYQ) peptidase subunit